MRCPSLVGRRPELAALRALVEDGRAGRGGWASVAGEAGIGKTRLIAEALAGARSSGCLVALGRCSPADRATAHRPLVEALLGAVGGLDRPAGQEIAPYATALSGLVPHWRSDASPRPESPAVLGESLLRVLRWRAGDAGAVLVLEDLHWADEGTVAVCAYLADHAGSSGVAAIATFRSEEMGRGLVRALERHPVLHLPRLTPDEAADVAVRCLGATPSAAGGRRAGPHRHRRRSPPAPLRPAPGRGRDRPRQPPPRPAGRRPRAAHGRPHRPGGGVPRDGPAGRGPPPPGPGPRPRTGAPGPGGEARAPGRRRRSPVGGGALRPPGGGGGRRGGAAGRRLRSPGDRRPVRPQPLPRQRRLPPRTGPGPGRGPRAGGVAAPAPERAGHGRHASFGRRHPPAPGDRHRHGHGRHRRGREHQAQRRLRPRHAGRAGRLGLRPLAAAALVLEAISYGFRGDREGMDRRLQEARRLSSDDADLDAFAWGVGRGLCALLREERAEAVAAFERAARADAPVGSLDTARAPLLLLRAVMGAVDEGDHEAALATATPGAAWSDLWLGYGDAVRTGLSGDGDGALARFTGADRRALHHPLFRAVGVRLVSEAALRDGWGDPVSWLQDAEATFVAGGQDRIAGACRAMLKRAGAPAARRRGADRHLPADLLRAGVTAREAEVLALVADRLPNKEIAARLFLSPRTVEKHVASLLLKLGVEERAALVRIAAQR